MPKPPRVDVGESGPESWTPPADVFTEPFNEVHLLRPAAGADELPFQVTPLPQTRRHRLWLWLRARPRIVCPDCPRIFRRERRWARHYRKAHG